MLDNEGKMAVVQCKLHVESIEGFSGHSDRRQLVAYLTNLSPKPERIFLCHGEKSKIINLANYIGNKANINTIVPSVLETFRLL
jgi:predicted metal-dependent RNase